LGRRDTDARYTRPATPVTTVYPPVLMSSTSYSATRLSSACSCLSVPLTTETLTAYTTDTKLPRRVSTTTSPIASAASSTSTTQSSTPSGFYKILFSDDFSTQIPGSLPSSSKWTIDLGTSYPGGPARWGNNEEQNYTASTDNLVITPEGTLRITPLRRNGKWTSARIETTAAHDISCPAGGKIRVQASIKLGAADPSTQQGIWPAFWMLGSGYRLNYTGWPSIGEIDVLESINGKPTIYHVAHCGSKTGGACNEPSGRGGNTPFVRGSFHTISVDIDRTNGADWRNELLSWRVDGVETFRLTGAQVGSQDAWGPLTKSAKFILLNVAVGGLWPGYSNAQNVDGETIAMDVKYVVVYSS
jgi:beta-glucanase (GH16 family)